MSGEKKPTHRLLIDCLNADDLRIEGMDSELEQKVDKLFQMGFFDYTKGGRRVYVPVSQIVEVIIEEIKS